MDLIQQGEIKLMIKQAMEDKQIKKFSIDLDKGDITKIEIEKNL